MQLFPHQAKALDETKQFSRVGYFLDMGLGKTFVGSEKVISLDAKVNLVVCQKSKVQDWIDHFKTVYAEQCVDTWDLTNKAEFESFFTTINELHLDHIVNVAIINYELTFRRSDLLKLEHFTLMLDESSMITNPTAKRSKFIHKMNPDNVILLSGTPTGGKYEKLWSQLNLLGWDISKNLFYKQYVITDWIEDDSGFKIPVITGYKNVDRLKDKLKQHGCIFMKSEEVFDLPEQVTSRFLSMSAPEQKPSEKHFQKKSLI